MNTIKRIKNYFRSRRERRLRKWCVRQVAKCPNQVGFDTYAVKWIHDYVKKSSDCPSDS